MVSPNPCFVDGETEAHRWGGAYPRSPWQSWTEPGTGTLLHTEQGAVGGRGGGPHAPAQLRGWGRDAGDRCQVSRSRCLCSGSHRCSWGYSHRVHPGGLELGGQVGQKQRVMRSTCRERGGGRKRKGRRQEGRKIRGRRERAVLRSVSRLGHGVPSPRVDLMAPSLREEGQVSHSPPHPARHGLMQSGLESTTGALCPAGAQAGRGGQRAPGRIEHKPQR